MAKQPGYQSRSTNSGTGELKSRLLFVLGALIVYRIGSFIPLPGIDAAVLAQLVEQQKGTIIDMLNMFSGGALSRASILALGIMPYISASIVMQLLATVSPALAELKKRRCSRTKKNHQVYSLCNGGFCYYPSYRNFYRFTEYVATVSAKYRFYFLLHCSSESCNRNHVLNVVR